MLVLLCLQSSNKCFVISVHESFSQGQLSQPKYYLPMPSGIALKVSGGLVVRWGEMGIEY